MFIMKLEVPSVHEYPIRQLGQYIGTKFDEREVINVPLRTTEQIQAARELEKEFKQDGLSGKLRNGPNAVTIYSLELIKL